MTRPNVLYLHSHDTGRYVQPYGYPVPTPNIQRLADQGVLFRQAFAVAPTCSGSRAALLTGEYSHQTGMIGLAHRGSVLNDYSRHLVHTLSAAGYCSALIGEQHVSEDPECIGYDHVEEIDTNHVENVAPAAIRYLSNAPQEPFFLSVGFFETHRGFFEPTSIRDALYSLPPTHLPDTPETRRDMAAFKASARSLDQGVGSVIDALDSHGLADNTHRDPHHRPRPAVPGREGHAHRPRARRAAAHARAGRLPRRPRRRTRWSASSTSSRRSATSRASPRRTGCRASRCCRSSAARSTSCTSTVFGEMTFHAAYEPLRSVRTRRWKYIRRFDDFPGPVLPNADDSPSKDVLMRHDWADRPVAREQLYDLVFDPIETANVADDPAHAAVLGELRGRLERWMHDDRRPAGRRRRRRRPRGSRSTTRTRSPPRSRRVAASPAAAGPLGA